LPVRLGCAQSCPSAEMRAEVEALISLPEYQQVEAEPTERDSQGRDYH